MPAKNESFIVLTGLLQYNELVFISFQVCIVESKLLTENLQNTKTYETNFLQQRYNIWLLKKICLICYIFVEVGIRLRFFTCSQESPSLNNVVAQSWCGDTYDTGNGKEWWMQRVYRIEFPMCWKDVNWKFSHYNIKLCALTTLFSMSSHWIANYWILVSSLRQANPGSHLISFSQDFLLIGYKRAVLVI